jgi:hypothetical protein
MDGTLGQADATIDPDHISESEIKDNLMVPDSIDNPAFCKNSHKTHLGI